MPQISDERKQELTSYYEAVRHMLWDIGSYYYKELKPAGQPEEKVFPHNNSDDFIPLVYSIDHHIGHEVIWGSLGRAVEILSECLTKVYRVGHLYNTEEQSSLNDLRYVVSLLEGALGYPEQFEVSLHKAKEALDGRIFANGNPFIYESESPIGTAYHASDAHIILRNLDELERCAENHVEFQDGFTKAQNQFFDDLLSKSGEVEQFSILIKVLHEKGQALLG